MSPDEEAIMRLVGIKSTEPQGSVCNYRRGSRRLEKVPVHMMGSS